MSEFSQAVFGAMGQMLEGYVRNQEDMIALKKKLDDLLDQMERQHPNQEKTIKSLRIKIWECDDIEALRRLYYSNT